ncbi:MAG: nitrite/sulfite reductase [Rhodocyclaceae bacterium]|nr:nitrite/sulfite reductase [Rhodocyclaceae bacterium]
MYQHDYIDQALVQARVIQFRDQTERFLAGQLSADDYRPLRLQNGLYVERHGPMLRAAIPYGLLSATQLRKLAEVARQYDQGVGHFTTRQNIQFNWVKIEQTPDILASLAEVGLHAIQTSGACIRSITTDHLAGVAADEVADPRPWTEILRQWSSFHPEFAALPRKFKIAVGGGTRDDRAALRIYDLAFDLTRNAAGDLGFRVYVGGGLGRTPILSEPLLDFLPWQHLLTYAEAILRTYNLAGRRDNLYKARIKILVKALGIAEFARQVNDEWSHLKDGPHTLTDAELERVSAHFTTPAYENLPEEDFCHRAHLNEDPAYARWVQRNVQPHKVAGYAAVSLSLKKAGVAPGDATAEQLEVVADLAERYSFGEIRVSHEQNLVLADVPLRELYTVWHRAKAAGLATPTIGLLTDLIACPGGDFCGLANARSIPVAESILARFDNLDYLHDIGELDLNISGCVNACGHHHVGHIGLLGVDKNNEEWYQVTLGGNSGADGRDSALGGVIGPSFPAAEVTDVVERLIATYLQLRHPEERFINTLRRVGHEPFKRNAYSHMSPTQTERKIANG